MAKNKLAHFKELYKLERVFQPKATDVKKKLVNLQDKWDTVFENNKPIVLELGCGKCEYTVGLAQLFPDKNFIGVDVKGARMWKGSKFAHETNLLNTAFIRSEIEFIDRFFKPETVHEIWVTFADPQPKKGQKRLTSSYFLGKYQHFLVDNAIINLKTDSQLLYHYTKKLAQINHLKIEIDCDDIYAQSEVNEVLKIQTFYEKKFRDKNLPITYLRFRLPNNMQIIEPEFDVSEYIRK